MSIIESFQRKIRIEYLADGLWKQDWVKCTIVEMLQMMDELRATHVKIVLPHPGTGQKLNYMLVKGVDGWSVKIGKPVIK